MRSNDAVETVKCHTHDKQCTAQGSCEECLSCNVAVLVLAKRHLYIVYHTQI